MTIFQIAWIIAGAIIGWAAPELLVAGFRVRIPLLFNMGFSFVGALIAYTLLR